MMRNLKLLTTVLTCLLMLPACSEQESQDSKQIEKLKASLVKKAKKNVDEHKNEAVKLDERLVLVQTAGLLEKKISIVKLVEQYIEPRLVDLDSGQFVDDAKLLADYSQDKMLVDSTLSVALTPERDPASIKRRENIAKVFLIKDEQGEYDKILLPVRAFGRFSMLYGYLALDIDTLRIANIGFFQHGETPGLGAEIVDQPNWSQQFIGKLIFKDGQPDFQVVNNHTQPVDSFSVDGISGATYTSRGVQNAINYWCGDQAFGPILRQLNQ